MSTPGSPAPAGPDPETSRYLTKNRIVAVDILRILAALCVMYLHLSAVMEPGLQRYCFAILQFIFGYSSPAFFVLAGYFACRNISWKKALYNAWWCFAPFILWNFLTIYILGGYEFNGTFWENTGTFLGIKCFLIQHLGDWQLGQQAGPPNLPLWFMRDLIFLFLASPLLYKWARFLFPALILLSICPVISNYFMHNSLVTFSPYAITYFTAGCFLRRLPKPAQQKALAYCSPRLLFFFLTAKLTCWLITVLDPALDTLKLTQISDSMIPSLICTWMLYQLARYIELKAPRLTPLALKLAPVTFLTFAGHVIIFALKGRSPLADSLLFTAILPIITFGIMAALFFTLKRWCRPLLHLVAHYKLRPDDYPPANRTAPRHGRPRATP